MKGLIPGYNVLQLVQLVVEKWDYTEVLTWLYDLMTFSWDMDQPVTSV